MKKISSKTYIIIILLFSVFFIVAYYLNRDLYKNYILEKIYSSLNHKIQFKDSTLLFFPSPGISLANLSIENKANNSIFSTQVETVNFYFSWKILYGNIILTNIYLINGVLNIHEQKENLEKKENETINFKNISAYFKLDSIYLKNILVNYQDKEKKNFSLIVNNLNFELNHKDKVSTEFEVEYFKSKIKGNCYLKFDLNSRSFLDSEILGKLEFENFALKPFKEYYKIAKELALDQTEISGNLDFYKPKNLEDFHINTNLTVQKFKFIQTNFYNTFNLIADISYINNKSEIIFNSIQLNFPKVANANASGILSLGDSIKLNLNINGEYGDIFKIVEIVLYSTDINIKAGPDFYSYMKINCKKAIYEDFEFQNADVELNIINNQVGIRVVQANTLNGQISASGKIIASNNSSYEFDGTLRDINVESLISKYSPSKYLKGNLSGNFHFSTQGNTAELFLEKFSAYGAIEVRKGELLGYANFLKPIFSLGKLVNVLGPKGKNTEFQTLNFTFSIYNKFIFVPNLNMIGVGLDAKGKGQLSFDRKIDFRVNVGLGGIAGKLLFVPIVYKGIMPNNISYIDPVWITSVYMGTTILAGPIGTTVGGIAGSAVSEYINKAWDGVKNIFGFSKKDNEKD